MGIVYLARHAGEGGFQRLFAIKVLHTHLAEDSSFVNMLHDEARIAARLHHPNVVPIVDLGTQEGLSYVVMEYVEGCTLAALLRKHPDGRPARLIVSVLIDALDGLHAAHTLSDDEGSQLNLVHRDVSPQNMLIGIDGASRITDFGIAKAETRVTATVPGTRKGKLAYMAPEQLLDDGARIDRRADVFSAGAVLWNALTGLSLFRGESDAATLHNILYKPVPAPSTVGLKPPAIFDEVCMRALERDPDKRYESAREMAEALRQIAITHRVLGSRGEVAQWVTSTFGPEFEERRKAIRDAAQRREAERGEITMPQLVDIAATGTISLPGIATSHSVSMQVTATPPEQPAPRRGALFAALAAAAVVLLVVGWFLVRKSPAEPAAVAPVPPPPGVAARPAPEPSPAATSAPEPSPAATPAPEAAASVEQPGDTPPESAPSTASRLERPAAPIRAPVRGGPRPASAPPSRPASAKPETGSQPAPAAEKPLPQPASEPPIERNPYLRKK
jgi:eukaryotic-like serine/threonine-protein kinase